VTDNNILRFVHRLGPAAVGKPALLIGCIAGNVHGNNAAIGLVIAMGQIMLAGLMVGLGLAWSMARKTLRASS